MTSSPPLFSIVIPTRDRAQTLGASLRTAVAAADHATEVVVHDNSTVEGADRIVADIGDPRVRHVRVRDLAMTDNWEAAVRAAAGAWVTVLGDDDGLMPFAVRAARAAAGATGAEVIAWRKARYCWPDRDRDADKLRLPAPAAAAWVGGREQLAEVLRDPRHRYGDLPMLYNAFVARSALDRIRRPDGRLLASRSPDVYSGAAIALTTPRFLRVGLPLSVNGLCGASNGVNNLTKPTGAAVSTDFAALNARAGLVLHPRVPDVRSLAGAALESCLAAIDALAPDHPVDALHVIGATLDDAVLFSPEEEAAARDAARRAAAGAVAPARVERLLARWRPRPTPDAEADAARVRSRIGPDSVQVDAARFGIEDVAAAVEFAAGFYDLDDALLVPNPAGGPPRGVRLRRVLGRAADELVRALRSPS